MTTAYLASDDIFVHPLGDHGWRVTDGRYPPNDARNLIGTIDEQHSRYEVILFRRRMIERYFSTLEDAVIFVCGRRLEDEPEQRASGLVWIFR